VSLVFRDAPQTCTGCHKDIHRGQFADACAQCHTPESWNNTAQMTVRHAQTRFPLTGVHSHVDCQACHAQGLYAGLSTECSSCHLQTYQATTNPDHQAAAFSTQCTKCHTESTPGWANARVNNADYAHPAGFPLRGGHGLPSCGECHRGNYRTLTDACYPCHTASYQNTTNPNHAAGQFSTECRSCHTVDGWRPAAFDHTPTAFPLTGAHLSATCVQCHAGGQFTNTATDCYSCHEANFTQTTNPNHVSGQFDHNCSTCHTTAGWEPATFDHNLSRFPLTGTHATTRCQECHINGQFTNTPLECYSCHRTNYEQSTNPNHVAGNYPHECGVCHGTVNWTGASFDHNQTAFPLTGAHGPLTCVQCHVNNQYAGTPTACFACHEQRFNNATNPNHVANQFSHDCLQCHTTAAFTPSTFNHATTAFPLTGAHAAAACNLCHVNGQYTNMPTACYSCHQANYEQATDPNHVAGQYDHACATCHSTSGWSPASIDHSTTAFPLTGAHTTVACALCHVGGQFHGTPADCYSCHTANYNGAANHQSSQYPHTCTTCHSTAAWRPSTFNHATTAFPLTGAHTTVGCTQCHVNGQFPGTPTDCYTCHTTDYNNAENHVSGQYPHTCLTCHNTTAWDPSSFNHSTTAFPLTGAHRTVACPLCHVNGQYQGTPTACFFCHQTDYNSTTTPNHNAAHFPTACLNCHTTTSWAGATFDHDGPYFPIYSGNHRNEWTTCADCHTNPSDFAVFSCITCHEHSRSNTDGEHDEVSGYTYTATSCYTCHPRGNGGDRAPRLHHPQRNDR
jgi:nitrate/TMAO reductase-like tetraheme cytochrome c subunit